MRRVGGGSRPRTPWSDAPVRRRGHACGFVAGQLGHSLSGSRRPLDTAIYYYHAAWYRLAHGNYSGAREFAEKALALAEAARADAAPYGLIKRLNRSEADKGWR